ncbi:hypothetical protein F0562_028342 [Nyssa sinensis]|uniref:Uncharacterized protein n=1 Tax=Nyssa sinensis TaxID=561372 RepID=A0A5J5B680_9ASTE|nr:hypothetical protein F0562_028342 [Nyssa sinensis]
MPPLRGFSFFGGSDSKNKGSLKREVVALPSLKLQTDKDVYRPGDPVLVTIEIRNPPGVTEEDRTSLCSLLVERLSFEIKGIEKLDTQWFITQKPLQDSKQRRGEYIFMDFSTTSIVSNQIVSSGATKTWGPIDHGHVVEGTEIQNLNLGRGEVGCSVGFRWGSDRENRYGPNGNYNRNKPNGGIKARLGPINGNSKETGKTWVCYSGQNVISAEKRPISGEEHVYKNRRLAIEKEARCEPLDNIQGKRAISNVNPNPIPTCTKGIGKAQVGQLEVSVPAKIKKGIGQLNRLALEAEKGKGLMVEMSVKQRSKEEGAGTSKGTGLGLGDQSPADDAEVDDDERGANTDDDFGWEDDDSFLIGSEDYTEVGTELGTLILESGDVGLDGGREDPLVGEENQGVDGIIMSRDFAWSRKD